MTSRRRILIEASNATVAIEGATIVDPVGRFDAILRVPNGEVRPGLINAHDHLHRNHYGRLGEPPYTNAYEWGRDIHDRCTAEITRGRCLPTRAALLRGAWKNLFAGVTTVVHHDAWIPELEPPFPVRVARVRCAHSLGFEPDAVTPSSDGAPFAIHLAEGVDPGAANEIRELDARGLLDERLLAVHVVGADDDGVRRLANAGAAVIWCPTSNHFLFDRTAPPRLLDACDVLLGSDSLLTGAGSLLDELRFARALGLVTDERLVDGVGRVAARRLRIATPTLDVGAPADLVVLSRPLLDCHEGDVALVICAGVPRVVHPELRAQLGTVAESARAMHAFGVTRWVIDA